jgi:hypothetical protein
MQIFKKSIPANSLISNLFPIINYSDCFYAKFNSSNTIILEDCVRCSFSQRPKWTMLLIHLRNLLVKPFGLKTGTNNNDSIAPIIDLSKGNKLSFFEILECNDDEVLLYVSDKHLDVGLSIILRKSNNEFEICFSTSVRFNNYFGHIYFFVIKPFHILIVRSMLNRMINYL